MSAVASSLPVPLRYDSLAGTVLIVAFKQPINKVPNTSPKLAGERLYRSASNLKQRQQQRKDRLEDVEDRDIADNRYIQQTTVSNAMKNINARQALPACWRALTVIVIQKVVFSPACGNM